MMAKDDDIQEKMKALADYVDSVFSELSEKYVEVEGRLREIQAQIFTLQGKLKGPKEDE